MLRYSARHGKGFDRSSLQTGAVTRDRPSPHQKVKPVRNISRFTIPMTDMQYLRLLFRGKEHQVAIDPSSTTLGQLAAVLANDIPNLAPHTLKVFTSKPKPVNLQLAKQANMLLSEAGILPGSRAVVLGSFTHELQGLAAHAAAEASLRLPGFEHEALRAAQRRRAGTSSAAELAAAAVAAGRFGSFTSLPLPPGAPSSAPSPAAALTLLHRIAADPAITAVMTSHGWTVGLLSEMPPEGKVGISSVCILGYNVNKGQEISLRLRTDDYGGFRKYLRIRETLVHELAHMVYGEHDNDFKALNSQLLQEVAQFEAAAAAGGRTLAGTNVFEHDWMGDQQHHEETPPAAAATEQRGRVLAAGDLSSSSMQGFLDARESAAAAALARWQINQQQQQQHGSETEGHPAVPLAATAQPPAAGATAVNFTMSAAARADQQPGYALNAGAASSAAAGADVWATSVQPWYGSSSEGYGMTDDPATAAAEEQMTRLGSFEPGEVEEGTVQQLQQQQALLVEQQQQLQVQSQLWHQQDQQDGALIETLSEKQQQQQQQTDDLMQEATDHGIDTEDLTEVRSQLQQQQQLPVVTTQADEPRPAAAAATAQPADSGISDSAASDDVVQHKLQEAQSLLLQLQQQARGSYATAVEAAAGVLSSLTQHPHELKYRRLRCGNAAFQRKLGQYPAAVKLLILAGFVERQLEWQQQADNGATLSSKATPEPVLVYARDDPGLLWLVLSVLKDTERGN